MVPGDNNLADYSVYSAKDVYINAILAGYTL